MMKQGTTTTHVNVCIEHVDGRVEYKDWSGTRGAPAIHKAARKKYAVEYPGARISFGNYYTTNSYGAH